MSIWENVIPKVLKVGTEISVDETGKTVPALLINLNSQSKQALTEAILKYQLDGTYYGYISQALNEDKSIQIKLDVNNTAGNFTSRQTVLFRSKDGSSLQVGAQVEKQENASTSYGPYLAAQYMIAERLKASIISNFAGVEQSS